LDVMLVPTHDAAAPRVRPATVAELAERSGLELLRFAYLLCGDRQRAEDLLQDVLLSLHRRFGAGPLPLDNPVGYARRALANANVSRARRLSGSEVTVDMVADVAEPGSDAWSSGDPGDRDMLWRALRRLPLRQRTVLVLRFYADETDADIAATLHCRRGTVRSLASRAMSALRSDPTVTLDASDGGAR
jgi:RNA polymerase sigma factor (sigma-70 family)